jgi:hypothetical protein
MYVYFFHPVVLKKSQYIMAICATVTEQYNKTDKSVRIDLLWLYYIPLHITILVDHQVD